MRRPTLRHRLIVSFALVTFIGSLPVAAQPRTTRLRPSGNASFYETYIAPWLVVPQDDGQGDWEASTSKVADAEVAAIYVCPTSFTMYVGEDRVLVPLPKDANGTILDGVVFAWTSSDSSIVNPDGAGMLLALAPGQVSVQIAVGVRHGHSCGDCSGWRAARR
jgi:hypothetical protein